MDIVIAVLVVVAVGEAVALAYGARKVQASREKKVSEDEIRDIVADNEELLDDEKRMIHEIIDLGDMAVREIMQPRVDMMLVEDVETVRHAVDRMHGTGYSRLPVFHEDEDNVVGIVHYKDLVWPLLEGKDDEPVGDYAYEALFVPESKDVFPLLTEMQTKHQQMAIVIDEYGGTDGLITVEDILEEIVGEIEDETDQQGGALIELKEPGVWVADGRLPVEDALELGWPVEDSDDYETLAGWVMSMLDSVPQVGDAFEKDGFRYKIQDMRRRRIRSVKVSRIQD